MGRTHIHPGIRAQARALGGRSGRRFAPALAAITLAPVLATATVAGPAAAQVGEDGDLGLPGEPPATLPSASSEVITESVEAWSDEDLADSVEQWVGEDVKDSVEGWTGGDIDDSVGEFVEQSEIEGRTTLSLSTDILFETGSWEVAAESEDGIATAVEDIPDGATVEVNGHTDSRPVRGGGSNQELSEKRAEAVAEVIAEARPDLTLETAGFADSEPKVDEDPEDPDTYAQNRRVEIVYDS
ncbi:OmpA family protein [Brevibacterium litoralis]|uniref:OmpA family protein n=1 Tax=Brevibacterium litoralis TaxID=3138935 RepID=UPI0032EFBA89